MSYPTDLTRTKNWVTETLTDTDLEGQLDLIIDWVMALANETTGHKHDGTENEGPKIDLASAVTGVLPIANGGTGESTLADMMSLVYPVGSVYANAAVSTNPATLLGFGTWVAIEGQTVVGLVAGGEFDTLGVVPEGETTHTLTGAESGLPAHNVDINLTDGGGGTDRVSRSTGNAVSGIYSQSVSAANAASAHNNIQPSYVCYVWRRTV